MKFLRILFRPLQIIYGGGERMALFRSWLYELLSYIARLHDELWALNLDRGKPFDDKEMHFLVMGGFGLLVLLACYLLFRLLARWGQIGFMSWLFALSIVVFVCFSIEIGQDVSNTGSMELADIVYGIVGFLIASVPVLILSLLIQLIKWLIRKK